MKDSLFKISNFNELDPFLMTITSAYDHWMYLSSSGCLTAGRQIADHALFPYITDDLLHRNAHSTGPITAINIVENNNRNSWQPFSSQLDNYKKERNLYKNSLGNKVIFEEINHTLGITFIYDWHTSEEFGFVRKARLLNHSGKTLKVNIVDGLRNILPAGIEIRTQQGMSNLANAYKVSEYNQHHHYALFYLNALLIDKPEPGESLHTNIVWSYFDGSDKVSVNEKSINEFILNHSFSENYLLKGKQGSYLKYIEKELEPEEEAYWFIVADVNKSQKDIIKIIANLKNPSSIEKKLEKSIQENYITFEKYIGSADAFQCTREDINDLHHTANVTYNILRGGVFLNNYNIKRESFLNFIKKRNKQLHNKFYSRINELPKIFDIKFLKEFGDKSKEQSLMRLCREYLPLTIGRRHGDPSRPWNHFNIQVKDDNGQPKMYYEGNWRDIFQNWEALGVSYPEALESMICIFLDATSVDGYNPYRITSNGIDWEVIEPDDNWSHIGYWNDHQIIYLLKLLEHFTNYHPNKLENFFNKKIFSYANVPYKIRTFKKIVENPKETIDFDFHKHNHIMDLVKELGSDGRLILTKEKTVYHVNMSEKLLVLSLAKICNYIPGAGIWLNTQRPEWNDANNALVGNGASMVSVYYLRRYLNYFKELLNMIKVDHIDISSEVYWWFEEVEKVILGDATINHGLCSDNERMSYLSSLGKIFENYRNKVYSSGFNGTKNIAPKRIRNFINLFCNQLDETIYSNRSKKGLFEAYNTIDIHEQNQTIDIKTLDLMLEGQVAALSSNILSPSEIVLTLESLFSSELYRSDMKSFILYPERSITPFLEKNIIDPKALERSSLLKNMIHEKNSLIIDKDLEGNYRFNSHFRNNFDLDHALKKLSEENPSLDIDNDELEIIFDIFESVFKHRDFTGRSGTMFSYEGIGSIYWHMISKLLLASQECYFLAKRLNKKNDGLVKNIGTFYYRVRNGLSSAKTPKEYGAFPFDPYSHTPSHSGAQQPGMTGQVKEEILTRFGELGCFILNGCIIFDVSLLRSEEFLSKRKTFSYFDTTNTKINLSIEKNQLAYTYCQVPIVYTSVKKDSSLKLTFKNGSEKKIEENKIDYKTSKSIFNREGEIQRIDFYANVENLYNHSSKNKEKS